MRSKKSLIVIVVAIVLLVAAAATLLATGVVYIGVKSPAQKVTVRETTCDDLIERYVKASAGETFNPSDEIKNLAANVPATSENDINCQYIKLYAAYENGDQKSAENLAKTVKSLTDQDLAVDGRLPVTAGVNVLLNNSGSEVKGNTGNGEINVSQPTSTPAPTE
jgi:flagellar basal body-associated protein FliL